MNRTLRSALVALLAVVAVAFAATTLDATVTPDRSSSAGSGFTGGGGTGGLLPLPRAPPPPVEMVEIPFLREILTVLAVVGALAALVYALLYRREALRVIAFGIAVAVGTYLLYRIFQAFEPEGLLAGNGSVSAENGSILGGAGGGGPTTTGVDPPLLLVLLAVGLTLAALAIGFAWYRDGGPDRGDEVAEEGTGPTSGGTTAEAAAVGRAAGRAADRIDATTDVDNEVYRAWREMTDLLDVEAPESSTPGEFAAAAVDAGLGREDVTELTRLFEDVRYGDAAVSAEAEARATAVLRRIEARYGEGDA